MTCTYEWSATYKGIIHDKTGCPSCSGKAKQSNVRIDEFCESVNIKRLGDFKGHIRIPILWQCDKGHKFKATPANIMRGTSCPKCNLDNKRLGNNYVDDLLQHRTIKRLDPYTNIHSNVKWQCVCCNYIWKTSTANIIHNHSGCPVCTPEKCAKQTIVNGIVFRSQFEARCFELLSVLTEPIQLQKRYRVSSRHTCDFYLPDRQTGIEVSTMSTQTHKQGIIQKQKWVADIGECFIFINHERQLKVFIDNIHHSSNIND